MGAKKNFVIDTNVILPVSYTHLKGSTFASRASVLGNSPVLNELSLGITGYE